MRLSEPLERHINANGRHYRADLDFRNVLAFLDILARRDILPEARCYLALKQIIRRPPKNDRKCAALIAAADRLLFRDERKRLDAGQRITDFEKDADYIKAAFLQAYGINLWRDRLHWQEFTALLGALPAGSKYMDILGIRARPLPEANKYNVKERESLIRAKAEYALELSDDEIKRSFAAGAFAMAESLKAYAAAKRGEGNG